MLLALSLVSESSKMVHLSCDSISGRCLSLGLPVWFTCVTGVAMVIGGVLAIHLGPSDGRNGDRRGYPPHYSSRLHGRDSNL